MFFRKIFNVPITLGFLSIGLYTQLQFEYNAKSFDRLAYKLPAAAGIAIVSAIVYHLFFSWLMKKISDDGSGSGGLYEKFSRIHLIFLGFSLFPFQYIFTKTSFLNLYLPMCVIIPFAFAVLIFFVKNIAFPNFYEWKSRGAALQFFYPAFFVLFLAVFYLSWHYAAAYLFLSSSNISDKIVNTDMLKLYGIYTPLFALLVSLFLYGMKKSPTSLRVRIAAYTALAFIFCFSFFMRYFDLGIYYFGGEHICSEIWAHMFYSDSLAFLYSGFSLFVLFMFVSGFGGLIFFITRTKEFLVHADTFKGEKPLMRFPVQVNAVFALLVAAVIGLTVHFPENRYQKRYDSWVYSSVPERLFVSSFISYFSPDEYERDIVPDKSTIDKLRVGGIDLGPVVEKFPLMKESIYFDKKNMMGRKPMVGGGANVIIVFAESFSQFFVDEKMHGHPGLTPNFDDFRSRSIYFKNMYNAISPTVTGIIASLGSFTYFIDEQKAVTNNRISRTKFRFITQILKERGYETIHLQGSSSSFASTETLFKNHGYDTFISIESEGLRSRAAREAGKWGLRDIDLMRYCVDFLKSRRGDRSVFMTISTIDMHAPYRCCENNDCGFGAPILGCVHSTDEAFGYLWDYIKNSQYYSNTIVVFIADHAITPNPHYLALRRTGFSGSRYDYIASAMYVPGNEHYRGTADATVCTNLDLTPTLLDVMNIDVPNPFLGLSIFSERPHYPTIAGREVLTDRLAGNGLRMFRKSGWSQSDSEELLKLLRSLTVQNRISSD